MIQPLAKAWSQVDVSGLKTVKSNENSKCARFQGLSSAKSNAIKVEPEHDWPA